MQKVTQFLKKTAFVAFYFSFLAAVAFSGGMFLGKSVSQQGSKKVKQIVYKTPSQSEVKADTVAKGGKENDIEKIASQENKGEKSLEIFQGAEYSLGKLGALKAGASVINGKIRGIILGKNEISAGIRAADGNGLVGGQDLDKKNFSFAVIGDIQYFSGDANEDYPKAVAKIGEANPDLIMSVGDLVSSCDGGAECTAKFQKIKEVLGPLTPKFYAAMGNHDRTGKGKADAAWQSAFEFPANGPANYEELTYSFDFGGSHFVFLNSARPEEHVVNKNQCDWLETDLANYQKKLAADNLTTAAAGGDKKGNIFVFFHEPAYPVSSKIGESLDAEKKERDALWAVFRKYQVAAVFNGHEHIQSRRNIEGIYQFVVGNTESFDHDAANKNAEYSYRGRHYALVQVNGQEVIVSIYNIEGVMINSFSIPR